MKKIEFRIEGMTCQGCSWWVEGTVKWTKWIINASVSHETKLVKIEYDENIITKDDIFEIIKNMNYVLSDIN